MKTTSSLVPCLLLLSACADASLTPTPPPISSEEPVIYVFNRTDYCEFNIEGTEYGVCGGVVMDSIDGTFRGFYYEGMTAYDLEEEMMLTDYGLHFVQLKDDIGELEVHFSAETIDATPSFSVRVEGKLYVPWTEFLSREYPHGDEPYYYTFGTMWVYALGYERVFSIDDQPDYPPNGWGWASEIAIDHVP